MKRFISALLSLVMAIGLLAYLPVQVYAVDITNHVLTYPVTSKHNVLTRGYMSGHLALDINPRPDSSSQSTNVEVMAACDGKVIAVFTGCHNWNGYGKPCNTQGLCTPNNGYTGSTYVSGTKVKNCMCNYSFGNGVIIYHPSTKTYSSYAHMKDNITVNVGDNVVAGQLIGYMGSYANSTGMHLHFDILNSTASSPSMSDYWKNFNSDNFVNTNPYGDITVLNTNQRYSDNINYNFVDTPVKQDANSEYTNGFPLPKGKVYNINCLAEYTVPYFDGSTNRYEHWVSLYHWKWGPLYGTTEDRYAVADIGATNGTKIFSVAAGTVWKTGYDSESGNWVIIHHSDGTYAYYGHMAAASKYKAGDSVSAGTQLGNVSSGHLHFEWSGHDPGCEYLSKGLVKLASVAKEKPHVHGTQSAVSFEFYSNKTAGTTSDTWLYPAFKVTVPEYKNSKISTVGYSVYTESGVEIYNFQETYRSGVNKDGTSYKNTFFGARTDGRANMDLDTDVYNIAWEYLTDARFTPGHTYKVKGFIIFDGKRYESSKFTMSTTGSKQCSWDYGKETKSPNCTSDGIRTYTCLVCGATKTETIPAKGHTPGAAATCTSPQKCTDCGAQLVPATDHKWDNGYITKEPTCMEEGVRTYTCIYCGHTETEPVAPKGHTPGAAATCTSPQKCTVCGAQLAPATGHNFDNGIITKEPTCMEEGVRTYTCSSCGTTRTEHFGGRGHIRGEAATCTTPQTCTVCGTQLAPALGHNYSGSYYYMDHPHEEYQKCTRCGDEKKTGRTAKVEVCSECRKADTFTIAYDANGGKGAPPPQPKERGKTLTLSSTKPTRQGYTFLGWATSASASNAQYNAGSSFTTDANTTLYAVWRKDVISTGAQLVVGNVTGRSGSIISVPISIKNNPGIYALRFEMDIDTNIFEFVSYDCSSSVFSIDSVSGYDSATKKFKLNRSGNDVEHDVVSDGIVTVIKLKIRDNAADGTYNLTACVDAPNTISINGLVKVSDGTGSVSISNYLLGDANGDGLITNTDLLFMKRYIFNKMSYPLPCPMSVVDINGDNECTNADILRVSRYIFNKDKYPLG